MKHTQKGFVPVYERKDTGGTEHKGDVAEVKSAIDKMGNAWEEFKKTNDARLKEIEKKGAADPLIETKLNNIDKFMDEQKKRIESVETAFNRAAGGNGGEEKENKDQKAHSVAYKNYLRKGDDSQLDTLQTKALSVGSEADGGYFVTPQMSSQIITKIFETSPMRQLATVETISSDALDIMVDADEVTAGWTGESSTRSETNTSSVGKKQIVAHELYAAPKATQKLLDDAGIDIEAWLAGKIADKFMRTENTAFINGTGVAQPRGLLTYASGTGIPNQIQQIGSGTSGAFTTDGLLALLYSLKEGYAVGASFLMTRTSEGLVRKLKDSQNRYMWEPSFQAGKPNSLLGVPVYQAADMPEAGAGTLSAAYGNFKQAYTIVDRMGIRTLRDPFTNKPFVVFYATKRTGGDVTNSDAVKLLVLT